jgi:hypothetical protein
MAEVLPEPDAARLSYAIEDLLREIYEHNVERWAAIRR